MSYIKRGGIYIYTLKFQLRSLEKSYRDQIDHVYNRMRNDLLSLSPFGSLLPLEEIQQIDPSISRPLSMSGRIRRISMCSSAGLDIHGKQAGLTATIYTLPDYSRSTALCTSPCPPSPPSHRPRPGNQSTPDRSPARRARGNTRWRTQSRR